MGAVGFSIEGVLGELAQPEGDETCVVGIPANPGVYEGRVHLVSTIDDLLTLEQGDVLVAESTGEALNSMLHLVGAIVTDHGSFACHAAIVARECGFPAVVGCTNATDRLVEGQRVRVDGGSGEVLVLT
jgi:pyruvate,water dikinase